MSQEPFVERGVPHFRLYYPFPHGACVCVCIGRLQTHACCAYCHCQSHTRTKAMIATSVVKPASLPETVELVTPGLCSPTPSFHARRRCYIAHIHIHTTKWRRGRRGRSGHAANTRYVWVYLCVPNSVLIIVVGLRRIIDLSSTKGRTVRANQTNTFNKSTFSL